MVRALEVDLISKDEKIYQMVKVELGRSYTLYKKTIIPINQSFWYTEIHMDRME